MARLARLVSRRLPEHKELLFIVDDSIGLRWRRGQRFERRRKTHKCSPRLLPVARFLLAVVRVRMSLIGRSIECQRRAHTCVRDAPGLRASLRCPLIHQCPHVSSVAYDIV